MRTVACSRLTQEQGESKYPSIQGGTRTPPVLIWALGPGLPPVH